MRVPYPFSIFGQLWPVLLGLILIDVILRGVALWRAGRNGQSGWFIALFVLNTAGILPIIYLLFFQTKKPS